jgi:hypothetical protein
VRRRKNRVEKAIVREKQKVSAGPPAALSRNLHHFLSFKHVAIQDMAQVCPAMAVSSIENLALQTGELNGIISHAILPFLLPNLGEQTNCIDLSCS